MSNKSLKPLLLATGALLLGGAALTQSAFAVQALDGGYQVSMPGDEKAKEGKCGEGKCGGDKKAKAEGKCGEGKCGEGKCGGEKKA